VTAEAYNEIVWSSEEMKLARAELRQAQIELATGKGWGKLALENAQNHLRTASQAIADMMGMDREPVEK
jgi:hypothetical protein